MGGFHWVLGGARNRDPIHNSFGTLWSSLCASSGLVLFGGVLSVFLGVKTAWRFDSFDCPFPHAAITFCMRFFGSYGGLQSFFLALRFDGFTNTIIWPACCLSQRLIWEGIDRSKDKPVANPWLCGDRVMVYVDVSNLEYPVLQIVVVGGVRIVMFASVCGLMLFVFSNGLLVWPLRCCPFRL